MMLSRILSRMALFPMFFLFMPAGHITMAWDLVTQPKQTMELRKHNAQAPLLSLLLAENLGRGQSAIYKVQCSI